MAEEPGRGGRKHACSKGKAAVPIGRRACRKTVPAQIAKTSEEILETKSLGVGTKGDHLDQRKNRGGG